MLALSFAAMAAAASIAQAATYKVTDTFIGSSFLTNFVHEAISDPTHGRVNYVDQTTAQRLNLTYASSSSFIMRADSTTTLSTSGPGRNSVRIRSNKQWTTHLEVLDVRHMPQGCGTWPAYWTVGDNWPSNGEIDIIEGVNDQSPNAATLHTTAGCTQPATRNQTGRTTGTDCNWQVNSNADCGVQVPTTVPSYGPAFNTNGGGWYAMERTNTYIKVWFWPRNSVTIPAAVKAGAGTLDTSTFGTPFASFINSSCDIAAHFGPENIVINLTFCGD